MDNPNPFAATTEPPLNLERLVAFALWALDLETVQRSTLRALFPQGETRPRGTENRQRWHLGAGIKTHKNNMSVAFSKALRALEERGWLQRETDVVVVHNRRALWAHAHDADPSAIRNSLNIKRALTTVRTELRSVRESGDRAQVERRHAEIRALLALLHSPETRAREVVRAAP